VARMCSFEGNASCYASFVIRIELRFRKKEIEFPESKMGAWILPPCGWRRTTGETNAARPRGARQSQGQSVLRKLTRSSFCCRVKPMPKR